MKLEKLENRPLTEDELLLRQAYRNGPASLWETPMNVFDYENQLQAGLVIQTPSTHLFKDMSKDALGITMNEIPMQDQAYAIVHPRYSYPLLHNHDYVEIVYMAAGHCVNLFENTSLSMNAGDVCILAPGPMHALSCTNDESCIINLMVNRQFFDRRFLHILQGGKLLAEYLEGMLFDREASPYILIHTEEDPWLRELARRVLTEITRTEYGYEYSISLLTGQFLLHLVREYEKKAIVPGGSNHTRNDLVVGILNYLSVNFNRTSLNETARFFGYSPAYLSRILHEKTGKTFHSIIAQMQVDRAVRLMNEGQRSFTEIAQEIGCFDTSHFNKKFKAVYGISPRQYLKQISTSPAEI